MLRIFQDTIVTIWEWTDSQKYSIVSQQSKWKQHKAEECFSCVSRFVVADLLHVLGATSCGTCSACAVSPVQGNVQNRLCQIDPKKSFFGSAKTVLRFWFFSNNKVQQCSVAAHTVIRCLGQLSICICISSPDSLLQYFLELWNVSMLQQLRTTPECRPPESVLLAMWLDRGQGRAVY